MGTARLASQPHSPAGAGQVGLLCACVGGCRTTLLGWRERGRPAPDWPPPAPSRALGGGGPCLRTCFQAGVGGSSRSPSVPPSLLSPRSVQDPAGCQGGPPPIRASTPPSAVRENAGPLGLCTRCWRRNSRQWLHFPWAPASPRRREFGQMVRKPFSGRPPSVGHIVGHRANFRIA